MQFKVCVMNKKVTADLAHIKEMMERSSRFISLSGLSGIGAGIVGLFTGIIAIYIIGDNEIVVEGSQMANSSSTMVQSIVGLGVLAMLMAIFVACVFTIRKSKKLGLKIWTSTTKRVLIQLTIPLLAGGIFLLVLLQHSLYGLIAGTTLVFYGLALINVEKYTFSELKYLGILEIFLGVLALFWIENGLIFWTIGFGVLHIIYGVILYKKHQ